MDGIRSFLTQFSGGQFMSLIMYHKRILYKQHTYNELFGRYKKQKFNLYVFTINTTTGIMILKPLLDLSS